MPNRILKESICTSESIDSLNWFEEVLFYRLIVNCDDFGRFDGRTAVIKSRLFPLKDGLTAKTVEAAVKKLVSAGLVSRYVVDGRPFLRLPTWNDHQNVRAKKSRYPSPDDGVNASENICNQMQSDENGCKHMSPESNTVSESESNPNTNAKTRVPKPEKKAYGEFGNVLLTDEEYAKLKERFPRDYLAKIEKCSSYVASSGKKYANHYATILNWAREDQPQAVSAGASAPASDWAKEAVARMMQEGAEV